TGRNDQSPVERVDVAALEVTARIEAGRGKQLAGRTEVDPKLFDDLRGEGRARPKRPKEDDTLDHDGASLRKGQAFHKPAYGSSRMGTGQMCEARTARSSSQLMAREK